jgi:ADP-ribose pyrophosphatase
MLVEHPESVAIIVVQDGNLVTVSQTRPGSKGSTVELPSGKLEPGETPAEAAVRELAEECLLAASVWREVGGFWAVPAYSTEYVHVFEASGIGPGSAPRGLDEDEDIEVRLVPLERALGELSDAVSIAAFALWQASK